MGTFYQVLFILGLRNAPHLVVAKRLTEFARIFSYVCAEAGTVVDKDACHPHNYDFFLVSQAGLIVSFFYTVNFFFDTYL